MAWNSNNPVIFMFEGVVSSAYNNWWHSVTYIWKKIKWEMMIILDGFKLIKLMRFMFEQYLGDIEYPYPLLFLHPLRV